MAAQETFSATSRAGELVPKQVEIGEITFQVRRTGKALKQIIELSPDEVDENVNPADNIDILYKGLSYVLVDSNVEGPDKHPDPDWLMDELDFEVAQELMEKFVPRRAEGNDSSAPETPSTPATESPA